MLKHEPNCYRKQDSHVQTLNLEIRASKHGSVKFFIMWLALRGGKMTQITRCDWLTRAGKMEPSCLLGTTCCIPQAKLPQIHIIINPLLAMFAWSKRRDIGLTVFFLRLFFPSLKLLPISLLFFFLTNCDPNKRNKLFTCMNINTYCFLTFS